MKESRIAITCAKSALKQILIGLLIFVFQTTYSQILSGSYYLSHKGYTNSTSIHFYKYKEFHYRGQIGSCVVSPIEGYGHYKIKGKKLFLNFDLTNAKRESKAFIERREENNSDSVVISFKVVPKDKKRNPFPYGYIVPEKDYSKSFPTNKEGKAIIKLPKSQKHIKFSHCYMGFPDLPITVKLDANYYIKMEIPDFEPYKVEDEVWEYQIKKRNENVLVIKKKKEKTTKWRKKINKKS